MRSSKYFRVHVAGAVVAVAMLLGASTAQAAEVILADDGFSVLEIRNLEIQLKAPLVFNVEFVYTTAFLLYGDDLEDVNFDEENAALALIATNDALNEDGRATRAGPESTLPYAIGVDFVDEGFLASLGGKYYPEGQQDGLGDVAPMTWSACRAPYCLPTGATLLEPNEYVTYASFTVVPEPGTAVLMGLGLAGLGFAGGRRGELRA